MSRPLRILSYNIHGGYDAKGERDLRRVHHLLEEYNIDIAVLQEMETRPCRGGTKDDVEAVAGPGRPYRFEAPTKKEGGGWYGNLIVSRFPLIRAVIHNLDQNHKVAEPRNAVDTVIDTPLGLLRVIGTHLSLLSSLRWWEIQTLIKLADEVEDERKYPALIMGDFNEWFWASRLISHLDELMIPIPCGKTFPARWPLLRLDRVWCDEAYVRVTAKRLKNRRLRTLSDHLPIYIEVSNLSPPGVDTGSYSQSET